MEGRVEIYCGQGRGKTSCAIGQCVKAAGQEKQIIMVQFLKGKETEELSFFKRLEPEVQLFRFEKYERLYEDLNEEEKKAEVFLKPEEVSLAIGKGGLNIKLASMLTEYTIDVFRELDENVADEDIYLDEFRDEIDGWVIDAIKAIGIDTAKAVLNAPREMLIEKTDLEEETVDEVIRILKSEFEEEGENSVEN